MISKFTTKSVTINRNGRSPSLKTLAETRKRVYATKMLPTVCHCTRLRRAAHAVTRQYDQALAGSGLTTTQFSLLRTISRLEQPYISTLADATGLERSTLGRNLRPLENAGLVEFGQGKDARTRLVRLSRKGKRTLDNALPQWQAAQDRMKVVLGDKKLYELETLLDEVIAS